MSPYLIGTGEGIEFNVSVRATPNEESPLASQQIDLMNLTLLPKPIPSADISLDELVYYTDALPDGVAVTVNKQNTEGYTLLWSVYRANGSVYEATNLISVSDEGVLTFDEAITQGVYRIMLTVKDEFGNAVTVDVQNIAVLVRAGI